MQSAIVAESGSIASLVGTLFGIGLWVAAIVALVRWWRARTTRISSSMFDPMPTFTGAKPASTSQRRAGPETETSASAEREDSPPPD